MKATILENQLSILENLGRLFSKTRSFSRPPKKPYTQFERLCLCIGFLLLGLGVFITALLNLADYVGVYNTFPFQIEWQHLLSIIEVLILLV